MSALPNLNDIARDGDKEALFAISRIKYEIILCVNWFYFYISAETLLPTCLRIFFSLDLLDQKMPTLPKSSQGKNLFSIKIEWKVNMEVISTTPSTYYFHESKFYKLNYKKRHNPNNNKI